MDGGFIFELGVFSGGFIPTSSNRVEWLNYWSSAQGANYSTVDKRFNAIFTVTGNPVPFVVGAEAWVFGRRDTALGSEWILFRHPSWVWPEPALFPNPLPPIWRAEDATAVLAGEVDGDGSPFLMRSEAVMSYAQWMQTALVGEAFDGAEDDPDQDGVKNVVEFFSGSDPQDAGSRPAVTALISDVERGKYLQMEHAFQPDRLTNWTVEVGSDLVGWNSGDAEVEVSLVVGGIRARDLTPVEGSDRRFMRLRVLLP